MTEAWAAAIRKASEAVEAKESIRGDMCGDHFRAFTRALTDCRKESPDALDTDQSVADMLTAMRYLLVCSKRTIRRRQVLECFSFLLPRPAWLHAAKSDTNLESELLAYLSSCEDKEASAKKLSDVLSGPLPSAPDVPRPSLVVSEPPGDPSIDSEAEAIFRKMSVGLGKIAHVGYVYPRGAHTENASDMAVEGFTEFLKGLQRIDCKITSGGSSRRDSGLQEYRTMLQKFDLVWPNLVQFIMSIYDGRTIFRGQCVYLVNKLGEVSETFRAAARDAGKMPWEPAPADAGPAPPPTESSVRAGVCSVMWIDSHKDAYEQATALRDGGINVVGFHDDYTNSFNPGPKDALAYALNAALDPEEHLIGIIINSGEGHKAMLNQISAFCSEHRRVAPFYAACSKRPPEEFEGCALGFIDKDRVKVQQAIVKELERRKAMEDTAA